jgi:RNA polymerase sigma factor (sigma-70 family)
MRSSGLNSRGGPVAVSEIAIDPDAFERFYRSHIDAVKQFVARRVDDPYLVADLTADVFVAAIDSAAAYDSRKGNPTAWLWGIARNLAAAEHRRAERERSATRSIAGRELMDDEELSSMQERIDAQSSARAIYREMDRLSHADRAVLELVALDGLGLREAAVALGITPVAARVRLHRARRRLQAKLPYPQPDHDVREVLQ